LVAVWWVRCAVYEPVAYTLAAVLGVVIIIIIILTMIAYNRLRRPYVIEPEPVEPEKPPDSMLGYPYPGYKVPERYVLYQRYIL